MAAAGERIARHLPVALAADDGMEWDDVGKGEEDEFLADWKSQVRCSGGDDGSQREAYVESPLVSPLSTDVRCAAALARQHGSIQQLRSGLFLLS